MLIQPAAPFGMSIGTVYGEMRCQPFSLSMSYAASVDPMPFLMHYGENIWAGGAAAFDAITERAAAPIIAKYTRVLAAADVEFFTRTTTFSILQSLRLDRGPSGPVHT